MVLQFYAQNRGRSLWLYAYWLFGTNDLHTIPLASLSPPSLDRSPLMGHPSCVLIVGIINCSFMKKASASLPPSLPTHISRLLLLCLPIFLCKPIVTEGRER